MTYTALCACRRDGAIGLFDSRIRINIKADSRETAISLVPATLRSDGFELYYIVSIWENQEGTV